MRCSRTRVQSHDHSFFAGLDYVSHTDVLPYKSTEKVPIKNELLHKFLSVSEDDGEFEI